MSHHPKAIFGRKNDPKIWDYIGVINTFYLGLIRLENELNDAVAKLDEGGIVSEDFESDIKNAIKDLSPLKKKLSTGIIAERTRQGA